MATPTKLNNRIGAYVLKTFKDESFRAHVPQPLPRSPELALQPLLPLPDQANQALGRLGIPALRPEGFLFASDLNLLLKVVKVVNLKGIFVTLRPLSDARAMA